VIPDYLPDYIERGGREVWRQPYTAQSADLYGFVLKADHRRIDELLDHDLVEPTQGAVEYRSASDRIVVIFATIAKLASAELPDKLRGYIPEREVSVWCLATDLRASGRLVWYLPYVFVDSGQASASGREVYGYPKQLGSFDTGFPHELAAGADIPAHGATTVTGLAIDPFAPNEKADPRRMISAEWKPGSAAAVVGGADAFADLLEHLGSTLQDTPVAASGPDPEPSAVITPIDSAPPRRARPRGVAPWAARRVLSVVSGRTQLGNARDLIAEMVDRPTLVFLKQFRDATCPGKACYQAVIEAPLTIDPFGNIPSYEELDPALFSITLADWASHPIASDLGAVTPQEPEFAFRASFDFDIQIGFEVWRAPT
jgi:hypothetical protein